MTATPPRPHRRPRRRLWLSPVVTLTLLAAGLALGRGAGAQPAAPRTQMPLAPERFLADMAPVPPAPVLVASREDAVASELMLRSHLISAAEATRAAHALCEVAHQEGDDPLLFLAVISVESGFDPLARSAVGAQGLMQLMPKTARALARQEDMPWSPGQSFDPVANVQLGVRYIAALERQFGHRIDLALTAYNRGPAATRHLLATYGHLPKAVGDFYAAPVMARYRDLKRRYGRLSWARSTLF